MADWIKAREGKAAADLAELERTSKEASYRVVQAAHAGEFVRAGPGGARMASKAGTRQVLLSIPDEMFLKLGKQELTKQKAILMLLEYAIDSLEDEGRALESMK